MRIIQLIPFEGHQILTKHLPSETRVVVQSGFQSSFPVKTKKTQVKSLILKSSFHQAVPLFYS